MKTIQTTPKPFTEFPAPNHGRDHRKTTIKCIIGSCLTSTISSTVPTAQLSTIHLRHTAMAAASSSTLFPSNKLSSNSLSRKLSLAPAFSVAVVVPRRRRSLVVVATALDAKPTVLVAEKLGAAGLDLLKDFANVDCAYNLSPEELCTKISLCDALIVRSGTKVSREVFEASSGRLKVVGRAGVGIDNVDLAAATEHGCLVVNAPTANTVAAAEHGIALLTAMARNVAQADASVKSGEC